MPLALQLVQGVLFTPTPVSPFETFPVAYGTPAIQFQAAIPPNMGSVAVAPVDGRNLVLQAQPGRMDLFASSVDPTTPEQVPGQFSPMRSPAEAMDLIEAAAVRVSERCGIISRLAIVLRFVESVAGMVQAAQRFSELTGLPLSHVGPAENILQTGYPGTLEILPGSTLNRLRKWQTETIYAVDVGLTAGLPGALPRIEHSAVTLNADANVIPQDGQISLHLVSDVVRRLSQSAIALGGVAIGGRGTE